VSATADDDAYYRKPSIDNPMQLAGCVIRFDQLSPSGRSVVPRTHANVSHYNVGCPNVRVDDSDDGTGKVGDLIIYQSGTNRVVTAGVFVDETLAARDIYCGISGGGTSSRIRCFQDGKFVPVTDKACLLLQDGEPVVALGAVGGVRAIAPRPPASRLGHSSVSARARSGRWSAGHTRTRDTHRPQGRPRPADGRPTAGPPARRGGRRPRRLLHGRPPLRSTSARHAIPADRPRPPVPVRPAPPRPPPASCPRSAAGTTAARPPAAAPRPPACGTPSPSSRR